MTDLSRAEMEDGMKMLALDIKDKTAEIARLRADLDSESMERADAEREIADLKARIRELEDALEWK
jgi:septal ring factor EnvC (AmiA/AmiB activator)